MISLEAGALPKISTPQRNRSKSEYSRITHQPRRNEPKQHRVHLRRPLSTPDPERPVPIKLLRLRLRHHRIQTLPDFLPEGTNLIFCESHGTLTLEIAGDFAIDDVADDNLNGPGKGSEDLGAHGVEVQDPSFVGLSSSDESLCFRGNDESRTW